MCYLIAYIYNPRTKDIFVHNLIHHGATYTAKQLTDTNGKWYEGHYKPSGYIECRTPSGDSAEMAEYMSQRWPSFKDFAQWCLIQPGVDPTRLDPGNSTALHHLAQYQEASAVDCMQLFVDAKCNINQINASGHTALSTAVYNANVMGVNYLLAHGGKFPAQCEQRACNDLINCVSVCCNTSRPSLDILKIILSLNIFPLEARCRNRQNALQLAVDGDCQEAVSILLAAGADPEAKTATGTAMLSRCRLNPEMTALLESAIAAKHARDKPVVATPTSSTALIAADPEYDYDDRD